MKLNRFLKQSDWVKCPCGSFHYFDGFYLDGKPLTIEQLYHIGMGWVIPCPNVLLSPKRKE